MLKFILCYLFMLSCSLGNTEETDFRFFIKSNWNLTKSYLQKLQVESGNYNKIIYGNSFYGYLSKNVVNSEALYIIPQGYKHPIEVYGEKGKQRQLLFVKQYKNPTPTSILSFLSIEVEKPLKTSFIVASSQIFYKEKRGVRSSSIVIILNRFGEIIWTYLPSKGNRVLFDMPIIKPVEDKIGILFFGKEDLFELVNEFGNVESSFANPFVDFMGDFIVKENQVEILSTTNKQRSDVSVINPFTNKLSNIYDSKKYLKPNSITYDKNLGYFISLRDSNQVVHKSQKGRITVFNGKGFQKGFRFVGQNNLKIYEDKLYILDNQRFVGDKKARMLTFKIENNHSRLKIRPLYSHSSGHEARSRGSLNQTSSGDLLVLAPNFKSNLIFEVDMKSKEEKSKILIKLKEGRLNHVHSLKNLFSWKSEEL